MWYPQLLWNTKLLRDIELLWNTELLRDMELLWNTELLRRGPGLLLGHAELWWDSQLMLRPSVRQLRYLVGLRLSVEKLGEGRGRLLPALRRRPSHEPRSPLRDMLPRRVLPEYSVLL